MRVYLCGHMTIGITAGQARGWRAIAMTRLRAEGFDTVSPMRGLESIEDDDPLGNLPEMSMGLSEEQGHDAAITRDLFDIQQADIVLANLVDDARTIGSIAEIAWAYLLRKPIVLIAKKGTAHADHPFMQGMKSIRFETLDEGINWIINNLRVYTRRFSA